MEAPRSPLAGRYQYLTTFDTGDALPRWAAFDAESGQHVLAACVGPGEVARWDAIKGKAHLHLAAVLDVVTTPAVDTVPKGVPIGAAIVVSEFVPGQTLHGQLRKGQIHPFKAAAWVLRLVDAITLVHQQGGVVGSISPRSIIVEPVGRAIAPVLAPHVAPPLAPLCSPERLAGGGPSAEDDVWALHASLYMALTGHPPFEGEAATLLSRVRLKKPKPLSDHGIDEPILQRVLERGLLPDERLRATELTTLTEALDAWERGREPDPPKPKPPRFARRPSITKLSEPLVFDVASLPDVSSIEVPESPPSVPPPSVRPPKSAPIPLSESGIDAAAPVIPPAPALPVMSPAQASSPSSASPNSRVLLLGGVGAALVVVVVLVVVFGGFGGKRETEPTPTVPVASSSEPSQEVEELSPAEQRATCVASYFELDVRKRESNLDFVCSQEDFRLISARLFSLARPESHHGDANPGEDAGGIVVTSETDRYDLGWYELAGTSIIRTTCCSKSKPIELPKTAGNCQQLQGQVRGLADASRKPIDLSPYGRKFDDAVQCLFSTGTKRPYDYPEPPSEQQQKNFQRFLKHAAESDAKRSRMKWLRQ